MQNTTATNINSGLGPLTELLQGLRWGDNVVWQVDRLEDYPYFARAFAEQAIHDGHKCVYLHFTPLPPILKPQEGLTITGIDPTLGFDYFSTQVHRIIEENGRYVFYIFDNLSALVGEWATDELLANFFKITCPYLFELGDVAYFALRRGQHSHNAVARIRHTTQVLIDVYQVGNSIYVHPIKVWQRRSPQMFLPHRIDEKGWEPVSKSGDAATILTTVSHRPIDISSQSIAPWDTVYRKLIQYQETGESSAEGNQEAKKLKDSLSRMMIGNHPRFNQLADHYLTLDDLIRVRNRLIGYGRIGGKAAGMLLARRVLVTEPGETDFTQVLEQHDSFHIGSDVFFTYLVNNDLFQLRMELSKTGVITWDEYRDVEKRFLDGKFPDEIIEQFNGMLDYYGQAPIIVRSSSLLEDSFTDAFAGKYLSEFCVNQGSPEERMEAFLKAVKLVYASSFNPDALSYRHRRGLIEGDEQMAILVQRVSGMPYKQYFFPTLAGVAFSRNLYAWTDRIDPSKGMIRLVFGMGTRAVNRVSSDYARMIAVSHPQLRPEIGNEIAKYSQRLVDVLDLESNEFETRPFTEVVKEGGYPGLNLLVSEMEDGYLRDLSFSSSGKNSELLLTFKNIIGQSGFVDIIGEALAKIEKAWRQPVDVEFTAYVDEEGNVKVNLLQCRSLRVPRTVDAEITLPEGLPPERILFRSDRAISAGIISDIRYILYIDPAKYAGMSNSSNKRTLGRVIGKLNEILHQREGRILAMGPGRWGSSNIDLGVNVGYNDIHNVAVLVEVAQIEAGHEPEVSYGTHFFQDLVEAEILYLPVYPD
ncbi:MAG TPA: phosphoenolpyruvate synthase, partial [Dehalococcoidia bacterium]|nr:phosphoenolpyruvate synthase [Dehalococcoidia bacterium]